MWWWTSATLPVFSAVRTRTAAIRCRALSLMTLWRGLFGLFHFFLLIFLFTFFPDHFIFYRDLTLIFSLFRYDFFIVSQTVREGTVAPTYYNVLVDDSKMTPEVMQSCTYMLCHMYFNWPVRLFLASNQQINQSKPIHPSNQPINQINQSIKSINQSIEKINQSIEKINQINPINQSINPSIESINQCSFFSIFFVFQGTIRVPAPNQYARKHAQLVAVNLHKKSADLLFNKMFYLWGEDCGFGFSPWDSSCIVRFSFLSSAFWVMYSVVFCVVELAFIIILTTRGPSKNDVIMRY